jgi:amino acid permease
VVEMVNHKNSSSLPIVHQENIDEKLSKVFALLIEYLDCLENYRKQRTKKNHSSINWDLFFLPPIIFYLVLFLSAFVFPHRITEIIAYIFSLSLLFPIYQFLKEPWKSIQQIRKQKTIQSMMLRRENDELLFDQELIDEFSTLSQSELKEGESRIKNLIENTQSK